MISVRAKFVNLLLRNRHLLQGKIRKEVFDFDTSIPGFRDLCEKNAAKYSKIPDGIEIQPQVIAGLKSEWLVPAGSGREKVILYVHGGGYVSGSCNDHRGFVSKFAKKTGVATLLYEYRLAPEHPWPAALDDSVQVYRWLLSSGFHPGNIVVAGESAGGGLCLALLLALKDLHIPLPASAVAISPWTDLTCSSDSYQTKNRFSLAPMNSWTVFSRYYAGENNPAIPGISPLFGDLHGLPPIFINSGADDELFEDGERFYLKAKEAGVNAIFRQGVDQVHCYPLLAPMFREATEAMDEIAEFIRHSFRRADWEHYHRDTVPGFTV